MALPESQFWAAFLAAEAAVFRAQDVVAGRSQTDFIGFGGRMA